jgi:hypothetical protein
MASDEWVREGVGSPARPVLRQRTNGRRQPARGAARSSGSTPFQWLAPQINPHDAAKRMYEGGPVRLLDDGSDTGGGLTRLFLNSVEIPDSKALWTAIGMPGTARRAEANGATTCWFTWPVSLIGQSVLDVYCSPPWRHVVPKSEAAQKPGLDAKCAGQTGDAEVGVSCPDKTCAKLEAFMLNGEMEHEADNQSEFHNLIVSVGAHVNAHVGDTPSTRVQDATPVDCSRQLIDPAAVP